MLSRLLSMDISEVAGRSRQQASKWLDRTAMKVPPLLTLSGTALVGRSVGGAPVEGLDAQRAFARFEKAGPDRFFAGAADPLALRTQFNSSFRSDLDAILSKAERIHQGHFDLLGYEDLSFGDPVDWRLDPVSGKKSALIHWTAIDPTDAASVGDVKVVWELNRHQFLLTLGVAYVATGDERHARRFADLFRSWMRENPVGMGINWASSLELAMRVISWTWALFLFRGSPRLTAELFAEIRAAILSHASHIERYLSVHSSPNTHLTGEALGLLYAGLVFPERESAWRFRARGRRILDAQIEQQVLPDGVYFEQATAYQIYTVEIYLHYLILAQRNRLKVSPLIGGHVQHMLDVLLALRRPDGGTPSIGDQDGGSLLPLHPRAPEDARGVFATAAGLFGRPDYAWAAERVQPESLWLLGPAVIETFASRGAAPPRESSRVFADGGYVVMRSGWQRSAHHLVFDVGPLGCPLTGGHGHADLLSVQVSPFGESFIVDPGTCVYAADPAFRAHFRGTEAHSTITLDGQGQAETKGPFGWKQRPSASLHRFVSTSSFDLAAASHQGYGRLADPVSHRRRVVFVKSPGYWVIVDDLVGRLEHRIEHRFQFAPMALTMATHSWVRAAGRRGRGLLVRAFSDRPLSTRIQSGSVSPIAGWVSPNYGKRMPAPVVVYSAVGALPLRILTLLFPIEDSTAPPPGVRLLNNDAGVPTGFVLEGASDAIRFDDDSFSLESAPPWKA